MDKIQIWADGDCQVIRQRTTLVKLPIVTNCQMWDINPSVHRSRHCKDSVRVRQASVKTQDTGGTGTHNTQAGYYGLLLLTRVADSNLYQHHCNTDSGKSTYCWFTGWQFGAITRQKFYLPFTGVTLGSVHCRNNCAQLWRTQLAKLPLARQLLSAKQLDTANI